MKAYLGLSLLALVFLWGCGAATPTQPGLAFTSRTSGGNSNDEINSTKINKAPTTSASSNAASDSARCPGQAAARAFFLACANTGTSGVYGDEDDERCADAVGALTRSALSNQCEGNVEILNRISQYCRERLRFLYSHEPKACRNEIDKILARY